MPTYTTYYNLAKPLVNNPTDEDLWGNELNDNMDIIDNALHTISTSGASGTPVGSVTDYAGSTAPTGWLFCFGQAVSRSTYSDLFTVVGTTYGVGDGSTTFNLPDLRGRVIAGKDDMGGTSANRLTNSPTGGVDGDGLGNSGGSEGHVLTTAQLASHSHTGTTDATTGTGTFNANTTAAVTGGNADYLGTNASASLQRGTAPPTLPATTINTSLGSHTHAFTTATAGSGDSHNNVQPTFILNKIIKWQA